MHGFFCTEICLFEKLFLYLHKILNNLNNLKNKLRMKHTEIPQNFDWRSLEWCDQLVFAQIKRFMNKDSRTCYPAMSTLKELTQLSQRFILDSIHRLESVGLIKVTFRKGTSNLYYFPPETDQFEMFSDEFLDMRLPPKVKEYYMKLQPLLFDKDQETAITHYSDVEIAKLTKLSLPTVKKYNKILQDSGYMNSKLTEFKDSAGLVIREMSFDMQKLGQFGLWVKAVSEQVTKNTDDIEDLKDTVKQQQYEIAELKRRLGIQENKNINLSSDSYEFK